MRLVLCDFDGTVTRIDSFFDFIQYSVGWKRLLVGGIALSPVLIAYKLKWLKNDLAKERVIDYFFHNWPEALFLSKAEAYASSKIERIVRPKAIEQLLAYQKEGTRIVIVSASAESWLKAWCDQYGFELVATQLEFKEGRVTGRFATKNCHGAEKVSRIKAYLSLDEYSDILAFGDTKGDLPMLSLAHRSFYKPFR